MTTSLPQKHSKSTLPSSPVFLAQTDTTVGFLCASSAPLDAIKNRNKPYLLSLSSFAQLQRVARVPLAFRCRVRHAHKTSYIYPNGKSARVVEPTHPHQRFLRGKSPLFSTSANPSGGVYDETFAKTHADIIAIDARGLHPNPPSHIYRLTRTKVRQIR